MLSIIRDCSESGLQGQPLESGNHRPGGGEARLCASSSLPGRARVRAREMDKTQYWKISLALLLINKM